MAEREEIVGTGEQITTTPNLPLAPEAQFRNVNARLEELAKEIGRVSKPPTFRLADMVQLGVIVLGLAVAMITAFGLNERINDLSAGQTAAEMRLRTDISATENRLGSRLEKLSDQFTKIDERTSTIEGQRSASHR
jgi:hypothetical protein